MTATTLATVIGVCWLCTSFGFVLGAWWRAIHEEQQEEEVNQP